MRLIREQDPLKQGLKHYTIKASLACAVIIREQDPLKQGLKLGGSGKFPVWLAIREQDPLKQGLKQSLIIWLVFVDIQFASKIH